MATSESATDDCATANKRSWYSGVLGRHNDWRSRLVGALRPMEMPLMQSLAEERQQATPLWTSADARQELARVRAELRRLLEGRSLRRLP